MSEDRMDAERSVQTWVSSGDLRTSFFALTFLLSVPFYVLHALAHLQILGKPEIGPAYIVLFTGMPLVSAAILTARGRGRRGVKELARRIFDFKRIAVRRWYVPILCLGPLLLLLAIGGMVLSGAPLPPAMTPLVALPATFVLFFLMATGEEVGWMGYAFEPMEARAGAFRAALVLGVIWALWHLPIFLFVIPDPIVTGAQLLLLVGNRVLVAWLFKNTGRSVFAAILFHAADNTALVSLPDIHALAPWGTIALCGLTLIAAAIVTFLWGPRTLTRYKFNTGAREVPNEDPTRQATAPDEFAFAALAGELQREASRDATFTPRSAAEVQMKRVTGIGGIFFQAKDPVALRAWYKKHLGIDVQEWGGTAFTWTDRAGNPTKGTTVWSIGPASGDNFAPGTSTFMINYRVEDLAALLQALREEGCNVLEKTDDSEFGKFGWVMDPEGNKVELWQPPEGQ